MGQILNGSCGLKSLRRMVSPSKRRRSIFQIFRRLDIRSLHAPIFLDTLVCAAGALSASAAKRPPLTGRGTARYSQAKNGESREGKPSHIRDSKSSPAKARRTYSDYRHGEQRRLTRYWPRHFKTNSQTGQAAHRLPALTWLNRAARGVGSREPKQPTQRAGFLIVRRTRASEAAMHKSRTCAHRITPRPIAPSTPPCAAIRSVE